MVILIQGGVIMKQISDNDLEKIKGGDSLSAGVINGIVKIIQTLYDAGTGFGGAIRRMHDDDLCPTK